MSESLKSYINDPKNKPVVFMLTAALGCLLAAIVAEIFLLMLPRGAPPTRTICLTIDTSGSMAGALMEEMQAAAKDFVGQRSGDNIALTIFSSDARVVVPFTRDTGKLKETIDSLLAFGATNFEAALRVSAEVLDGVDSRNRALLVFTDGENTVGDANQAIRTAERLRGQGIEIFAIAALDANVMYLEALTGDRERVIDARGGNLREAFGEVERMISATVIGGDFQSQTISFIATMGWMIFAALGIALVLVAIQNYFLKKPLLPREQMILVVIGAAIAGVASGFVAQTTMTTLSAIHLGEVGRVLAWSVMGGLLAFGMVYVIPNLNKAKALQFGVLGGFLGCIGFLIVTAITGDTGGRLIGAFILGACIGLLVAIVETYFRNVWLMVVYDPRNVAQVNLGSRAVTVGSGNSDTVLIPGVGTKMGTFLVVGDTVQYTDANGTQSLMPGNRVNVGGVELVICSKEVQFAPSKFYPMKMSRARELMNK